jgi:hypothetical protein
MMNRNQRSRSRKTHCFSRALRHELLECRNLMAGDIVDTPADPFIDISSGHAEVRAALDFEGDIDALRLDVSTYDSFAAGAWKTNGESLKLRVLDATGQDISDTVVDSSGVISLVGSATGAYSLAVSSDTNEVADYIVRVKAWTDGVWTTLPETDETDDADGSKDPSGGDPSGRDPEVGIPDGSGVDMEGSDGGKPEEDFDIRIVLRDGVYHYEDEVKRPVGDSPSSDGEGGGQLIDVSMPLRKHNAALPADVDGDASLTPLDALKLINLLNQYGGGDVASFSASLMQSGRSQDDRFIDTNDDGFISPLDVLFVINKLNSQSSESAVASIAGEGGPAESDTSHAVATDWVFSSGDDDEKDELLQVLDLPLPM